MRYLDPGIPLGFEKTVHPRGCVSEIRSIKEALAGGAIAGS